MNGFIEKMSMFQLLLNAESTTVVSDDSSHSLYENLWRFL